jgi:cytochrome c
MKSFGCSSSPPLRLLALVAALLAPLAWANPELARARLCLSCHALHGKVVGPGFHEVAQRYAGQPGAAARLAAKIRSGGSGAWGVVPMPANPKVTPEEARQLADWVLSLK